MKKCVFILCFLSCFSHIDASWRDQWVWFKSLFSGFSIKKPTITKKQMVIGGVGALTIAGSYLLYKKINQQSEAKKLAEKIKLEAEAKKLAEKIKLEADAEKLAEKIKTEMSKLEQNTKKLIEIEKDLKELTDSLKNSGLSDEDKKIFQEKIHKLYKLRTLDESPNIFSEEDTAQQRKAFIDAQRQFEKKVKDNEDIPELIPGFFGENIPVDKAQEVKFKVGDTVKLIKADDMGLYENYINKIGTVNDVFYNKLLVDMAIKVTINKNIEHTLRISLPKDHFEKVEPVTQEPLMTINNPKDVSDNQKELKEKEALLANFEQQGKEKKNLEEKKLSKKVELSNKINDFEKELAVYENLKGKEKDAYYLSVLKPHFEWLEKESIEIQSKKKPFETLKRRYNEIKANVT